MFILLLFGHKQNRIFTIDCLTASLIDCIWTNCFKDIYKLMQTKEELFNKEIGNIQKKFSNLEKKLENVEKQIKEEEKKLLDAQKPADDKKKGPAKPPPAKKKDLSNPLEKEKAEILADIEKTKEQINKYNDKLGKLKIFRDKYTNLGNSKNLVIDLVDKQGERKFIKSKLDTIASNFLSDKNSYYLASVIEKSPEEEEIELVNIDGYCLRTIEEDEKAVDDEQNILDKNKKDNKKKAGKK